MNNYEKTLTAALAALFLLLVVAPASAGPLSGHLLAYNDGNGPSGGAWTDSTTYNTLNFLTGTVDWAVFTAADFNTAFPASGYTPPAGDLVYTYQINNTGTFVAATGLSVGITQGRPTGTIGSFSGAGVTGDVTTGIQFTNNPVDSANYTFTGISAPNSSTGLVFSSPNVPESGSGTVSDSGLNAAVIPLPTPSSSPIPEPATSTIMACLGMVVLLARRRSRKIDQTKKRE